MKNHDKYPKNFEFNETWIKGCDHIYDYNSRDQIRNVNMDLMMEMKNQN